jgi:hypothetical protein
VVDPRASWGGICWGVGDASDGSLLAVRAAKGRAIQELWCSDSSDQMDKGLGLGTVCVSLGLFLPSNNKCRRLSRLVRRAQMKMESW